MKIDKNIEAIIFDLDGTLVDSMWIWKQIDIDFLLKRGIELPEDLQKSIEGMSFTETANYFIDRFELKEPIDRVQAEWNDMALELYKKSIPLKNGVRALLDAAIAKGIPMGIGTSNSRVLLMAVLEAHGIHHLFKSIRTSCEVEKGKPHPDIFLKVAEDLGVKPENCLVFEDTHAGVIAGKSAGMQVVAIFDALSEPYADVIQMDADGYVVDFKSIVWED